MLLLLQHRLLFFFHVQVLGCIGEVLDESGDVISGVAVNIRKREDRVSIWTRTSDPVKVQGVVRFFFTLICEKQLGQCPFLVMLSWLCPWRLNFKAVDGTLI